MEIDNNLKSSYPRSSIAEDSRGEKTTAAPSAMPARVEHPSDKKIWRIDEVAKFLGCSKGHIYNLSSDEKIPKIKKGKFLYFVPSEILEWILQGDFYNENKK